MGDRIFFPPNEFGQGFALPIQFIEHEVTVTHATVSMFTSSLAGGVVLSMVLGDNKHKTFKYQSPTYLPAHA